jgi:CDP-2,3-bis-(O-geranylgeranyl)-sn-glycerol synthase
VSGFEPGASALRIIWALVLLGTANGAPIVAKWLLGGRFNAPLDFGVTMADGQPLFGASKTFRGLAAALAVTAAAAALLGLDLATGAAVAALAMAGDLLTSFAKRRLGQRIHDRFLGVDQIPEALLPLLVLHGRLGLGLVEIAVAVVAFVALQLMLSRLLFRLHIRDRPY